MKFGFTCQLKGDMELPQCVVCYKVLGNDSMNPGKLQLHLGRCHPELVGKDEGYFEGRNASLKKQRLDSSGAYHEKTTNAVRASYVVAYKVAQAKKPHTIVEELVLPCAKEMVRLVLEEEQARKFNDISVSNDTVARRIGEISANIRDQVVVEIKNSPLFTIQLDESTDDAMCSQLLVFARYVCEGDIKDELLFCKALDATTKATDVMQIVNDFFYRERSRLDKSCRSNH